MIPKSNTVD
jgi:hypothetical protein